MSFMSILRIFPSVIDILHCEYTLKCLCLWLAFSFLGRLDMSLKDNSNNPALLEPALDAIIQLETEDEKVIWDHLQDLQTQMNRIEGLPSSILKRMDMLMKLRHSSKKNKHHGSKLLNKAKNFCEEAKGMFKLKSQ